MAFKLTASDRKQLDALVVAFETAREELREWVDGRASDAREKFDEKTDRWRESDAGQTAEEWVSSLEALAEEIGGFEIDLFQVEG